MALSLKCPQIMALLTFYIRNKLDLNLTKLIKEHLEKCPICYDKYLTLKTMMKKIEPEVLNKFETKSSCVDENLISTISAYVDNELKDNENLRVKRHAISNSAIRKTLEDFYSMKKVFFNMFEKDKQDFKYDFSKNIMRILNIEEEVYKIDPVLNAVSLLLIFVFITIIFAIIVFWV